VRRELGIALRARITWLVAAVAALLVGHGFVLSNDLFSASSRSALASALQAREMDPLSGIVRPTLGGVSLAISLFAPLVAARVLSVEKERRTFGALCLHEGSSTTVVLKKSLAALAATGTLLVAAVALFVAYRVDGGHLDGIETALALGGEALHVGLVTAVSVAASAWTRTLAQAATLGIVASLTSWAIDAADGFAALAWLGGASAWSIERKLEPFQRGILSLGSVTWLLVATLAALVLALIGTRFDVSPARRVGQSTLTVVVAATALAGTGHFRHGYDWSEGRRASLPPAAVEALRALRGPIAIDVFLDRDDSRRRQLEGDTLSKLVLARPDLALRMPLDETPAVTEGVRDDAYGRIVIRVGSSVRETRSASRREITTLIFEAAGLPLPEWSPPPYPGFPHVTEGARRTGLVLLAYFALPATFLAAGFLFTRRRSIR
jgi:ABC-type transport system involved in multi-copper enzyme maturation permease subunit